MKRRHRLGLLRSLARPGLVGLPDANADAREDVAQLATRGPLVPAATAAAFAVRTLVHDDALALAVREESQLEHATAVREFPSAHAALRGPSGHAY